MSNSIEHFFRPNIVDMLPYIPGEQPPPGTAIKLNTNENPYPPSIKVLEAIIEASSGLQRYPDPLATKFRIAASKVLNVSPDQILCGNGSDDILTILTRAFVGEQDCIRFPNPSYILYRNLAQLQNASIEEIRFADDWTLPPAFFEAKHNLKLIYIPNPNSPTGTLVPPEQIVELSRRVSCPIVVDEAYVDFAPQSCIDLPAKYPNILVSRTLSKSYALAGLRFGFLVGHPSMISMLRKVKDSYNTDAIANAAATAAIDDQTWLKHNIQRCNSTRSRLTARLEQMNFACIKSEANFVWAKPQSSYAKTLYEALRSQQIFIRYMNYTGWADGLRISVGTDAAIDTMLAALRDALKKSPPTTAN